MGKRRASTLSETALKAEKVEAMNSFYAYESMPSGRIPFDVFGRRARDIKRKVRQEWNTLLHANYRLNAGSPATAVESFRAWVEEITP